MFKLLLLVIALAAFTQAFPLPPPVSQAAQHEVNVVHIFPDPVPSSVLADTDVLLNSGLQTMQQEMKKIADKLMVPELLPVLGEPGIVIPSTINPPRPDISTIKSWRIKEMQ